MVVGRLQQQGETAQTWSVRSVSWAVVGESDDDQDDEEPGAGEYHVGQDVLTSVNLRRGSSGSRIWPSTAWRRARGIVGGV